MKFLGLITVLVIGAVLFYASQDFPQWGDPLSPASSNVSAYYLTHSMEDTSVPNVVTAVLADYRGFDTMLETVVIFCAGMGILLLLRVTSSLSKRQPPRRIFPVRKDPTLIVACRVLFPASMLFALYVISHGHHSPGGGFQGGVILGANFILMALAFNLHAALMQLYPRFNMSLAAFGVTLYASIGLLCLLLGGNFLDYGVLSEYLPIGPAEARSLGILGVEIGVGFTVMAIMFSIYADISTRGRLRRGL